MLAVVGSSEKKNDVLAASKNAGRLVGVKVRDVLVEWPPHKWAAVDPRGRALASDPGKLRLLWFSLPDGDGWFSLTATDSQGSSWSAYCRAPANLWRPIERALGGALRVPLEVVGDMELDATKASLPNT